LAGVRVLTPSRLVVVGGAGIGGLTAALALARTGFRVIVLEQSERLEETGAGIQLSPNAARILIDLGLEGRLRPLAVAPTALRVMSATSGREIVRMPLGEAAERRYGAPFWVIHRGDLHGALTAALYQQLEVTIKLGMRVEDFVTHTNGVTVSARSDSGLLDERGAALIAADGLWSIVRGRIDDGAAPAFVGRTAWRGLVPAAEVAHEFREPLIHLWLGRDAHVVHYPIKGGRVVNIVVITGDTWEAPGWSQPASRADLVPRIATEDWALPVRALLGLPEAWLKWALYERQPIRRWSRGPVALLGDAAHPMLPYLAQGAAMAIEDAAVAAQCLARQPEDAHAALRAYWTMRHARVRKVQNLAARNGTRYHMGATAAAFRNATMRIMGGKHLLRHYDWLYGWRPPEFVSSDEATP
jgi:salicylate hydroxylase